MRICAIHANFVIIAHKLVLYARKNAHIQSSEQYIYGLTCADLGVDRWIKTSRRRVVFDMVNPELESEAGSPACRSLMNINWKPFRRAPYSHR